MLRLPPANRTSALIGAAMLAGLVAALCGAAQRFDPAWDPRPLVGVCLLIGLEAGFVQRAAQARRLTLGERLRYLAPELLALLVAMRAVATLGAPAGELSAALQRWLYDPLSIFDTTFAAHCVLGLMVGWAAHATAADLAMLAPAPGIDAAAGEEGRERYAAYLAGERAAAMGRLASRFATGGGLLLLALTVEAIDVRTIGGAPLPIGALSVAGALCYVGCGFLLQSRARLALLQSRWQSEGAHVAPAVARRWSYGSALLIAAVLAAAALLPRSYGMGLVDALRAVLGAVGSAVALIGYIVTYMIGMLLLIPAWLLSLLAPADTALPSRESLNLLPPPEEPIARDPQLLPALIFWLCVALLAGIAGRALLRRHPHLLHGLRARLLRLLRELREIWRGAAGWAALVAGAAAERLRESAAPRRAARRAPASDPRAQVVRYYRALLDRAAEVGHPRRSGQTPLEYGGDLAARLPDAAPDLGDLTDGYLRARYAPGPVEPADARRARGLWQRLRRALR